MVVVIGPRLPVEVLQALVVHGLDLGQRIDDALLGDGGGDACEHEEPRLESVVRCDDERTVTPMACWWWRAPELCPSSIIIISTDESVVALSFDIFENAEEDPGAKTVSEEGQTPACKDASHANLSQLALCVGPHALVFIVSLAVLESDLQGIQRRCYQALQPSCCATCRKGRSGWRGWKRTLGRLRRRFMKSSEDLKVACIQHRTDSRIRKERRQDLLRYKTPTVGFDRVGKQTGSGGPP